MTTIITQTTAPAKRADLRTRFCQVRAHSMHLCAPLSPEDYVVQPIVDVSPPKWHLGHTTWFFETFILKPFTEGYSEFDADYNYVFNSYYESVGARVVRTDRGNLSRPTVEQVKQYRAYVDVAMEAFLQQQHLITDAVQQLVELGLQHEQQHQELLLTDIKYILGNNPLQPAYNQEAMLPQVKSGIREWILIEEGIAEIGYNGDGFCFDNELGRHKAYLAGFAIASEPVTNREFLEFIEAGGYQDFRYWHSEGWEWVKQNQVAAPMYWQQLNGQWYNYSLKGVQLIDLDEPVCHVSYYEAWAFAAWKGCRLPTEQEWEAASTFFNWGRRWEWTESAYLPYPGFIKAEGAIGEYNGKFMVSQMVLRGASDATPQGHSRPSYRNFFHPNLRWQFTGIRLARTI